MKTLKIDGQKLFELLQILGAKKPYKIGGELTRSGAVSYAKFIDCIYFIQQIDDTFNANEIVDELDNFISQTY